MPAAAQGQLHSGAARGRWPARSAAFAGLGSNDAATLNLAQVRQRGAQLGANEVHVYFRADSDAERALVACDLRAGQFGGVGSEPRHAAA